MDDTKVLMKSIDVDQILKLTDEDMGGVK